MLAGKPLIAYSIENALQCDLIDDVVVTTDSEEIQNIAEMLGASIINRPKELAADNTTLDPVIHHAVSEIEARYNKKYDLILTLQPTSPLLEAKTLEDSLKYMHENQKNDCLIAVKIDTALYWKRHNDEFIPLFKERKNRQFMAPIYKETGAFLISRRDIVTQSSRIGHTPHLFELSSIEGIDIDNYEDWWIAEKYLNRRKIVFRVDGNDTIGLGHVYRAITLNDSIFNDDVFFLMKSSNSLGIEKAKENIGNIVVFNKDEELIETLKQMDPDIIINDILDTDIEYMEKLMQLNKFIVNFEDLGTGADMADVVINALYERSDATHNRHYGYNYSILRDEFSIYHPKEISEKVNNVLITFGGTDPNDLTTRTLKAIDDLELKDVKITVILGLGYKDRDALYDYVNVLNNKHITIVIKENIKTMAKHIQEADIVITSNGRTIYEVASLGTPCISCSQNEREVRHLFTQICKGVLDLGIESNVSSADISGALEKLIGDYEKRKQMSEDLLKFELKKGTERVLELIFTGYRGWKDNNK